MKEKNAGKREKTKLVMGIAMMLLAVGIAAGTYAYYQTTISGTVSGSIVEWACTANNSSSTFTLSMGSLKPGSTGTLALNLSVKNFKALFTVSLSNASNIPTNLNFYTHSATQTSATCLSKTGASVSGCNLATTTKTLDATSSGTATGTLNIYYKWPLGTTAETAPTSNQPATIKINVTCKQENAKPYGA